MTGTIATGHYRLRLDPDRMVADVRGADSRPWFRLRLLGAVDAVDGPDETIGTPTVDHLGRRIAVRWKAWDPEGAPAAACVRRPDGTPVAIDPESRAGRRLVEDSVRFMLGRDGLDADGLKVDFLARTPSGGHPAACRPGLGRGAALLHELLRLVYTAAKRAKPDSLIVTHTPNPAFLDVTDMIRLNDIRLLGAEDPEGPVVEQMRYRAAVVAAACPGVPVDTDGWCLPTRADWAAYLRAQPELGIPALYHATHIDHSGEPLRQEDLNEVARVWQQYRRANNLLTPTG